MISRLKIHSTHNGADLFCINPHLAAGTAAGAQQARPVNVGGRDRETEVVCLNPAEVLSESTERMKLRRLLEQYGLEDEDEVLDNNDVKKDRDLSFIDDDVLKDLTLSPVSKGKLRKLVKALGASTPDETSETVHDMHVDQVGVSKYDNGDLPICNKVFTLDVGSYIFACVCI